MSIISNNLYPETSLIKSSSKTSYSRKWNQLYILYINIAHGMHENLHSIGIFYACRNKHIVSFTKSEKYIYIWWVVIRKVLE